MSTTASITRPTYAMHNPPHPGEVLRDGWLEPLELSVTHAAERLGVTRKTLSAILNGRAGISADMAMLLAKLLGTTAEFWLLLQIHRDLWLADRRVKAKVLRVTPLPRPRVARAQLRQGVAVAVRKTKSR